MRVVVLLAPPDGKTFDNAAPATARLNDSFAQISLATLDFSGGLDGSIIDEIKGLFRSKVESNLRDALREKLGSLLEGKLSDLLGGLNNLTTPYRGPQPEPDRLAGEAALSQPPAPPLVDLNRSVAMRIAGMVTDGYLSVGNPLGINKVVEAVMSGGQLGVGLHADVYKSTDNYTATEVKITKVSVGGINSFTRFVPLQVLGPHTLRHLFDIDALDVHLTAEVSIAPSALPGAAISSQAGKIVEQVTATTRVSKVSVDATTLIAVAHDAAAELSLGSLYDQPLSCPLSALWRGNITAMSVTVGQIDNPVMSGFITPGLDRVFTSFARAVWEMYSPTARGILPAVSQRLLLPAIDKALQKYITNEANRGCAAAAKYDGNPSVDFQSNKIFHRLKSTMDGAMGISGANDVLNQHVVGPLTEQQSGTPGMLRLKETFKKQGHVRPGKSGVNIDYYIEVSDLRVEGLDTLSDVSLVSAVSANELLSSAYLARPPQRPLVGSARVRIQLNTDRGLKLHDELTVTLQGGAVHAVVQVLAQVDENAVRSLRLSQLPSLDCWLATLQRGGFTELTLSFGSLRLDANCTVCSSPGLAALHRKAQSREGVAALTAVINSASQALAKVLLGVQSEEEFQQRIERAARLCQGVSAPAAAGAPPASAGNGRLWAGAALGALLLCLGCCGWWCRARRSKLEELEESSLLSGSFGSDAQQVCDPTGSGLGGTAAPGEAVELETCQGSQVSGSFSNERLIATPRPSVVPRRRKRDPDEGCDGPALLFHPSLPTWARFGTLAVLLGTIAMFISGHVTIGASVDLSITFAGESLPLREFAKFSLGRSIKDMWHAGAIPLAVLVGSFSGLWPYIKVLLLIYAWVMPERRLGPRARERLLERLDKLGKWSLIDVFVLTMTMVGFRLHVQSPQELVPLLGSDFYVIDVSVTPCWGLYAFMFAATGSLVINTVMLNHSRDAARGDRYAAAAAAQKAAPKPPQAATPAVAVVQRMSFASAGEVDSDFGDSALRQCRWPLSRLSVLLLIGGSIAFAVWGATVPAFTFRVDGIAGKAIESGEEGGSQTSYSLLNIARHLARQAQEPGQNAVGIWFIIVSYLAFAFAFPVAQLCCLGLMWMYPVHRGKHRLLYHLHEVVAAFAAMEVFVLGIFVSVLEIGQVSKFLLDHACDNMQSTFDDVLVPYGFLLKQDATCFHISAWHNSGLFVLIAVLLVANLLRRLVLYLTRAAVEAEGSPSPPARAKSPPIPQELQWRDGHHHIGWDPQTSAVLEMDAAILSDSGQDGGGGPPEAEHCQSPPPGPDYAEPQELPRQGSVPVVRWGPDAGGGPPGAGTAPLSSAELTF
eukprot:TRINITY_DN2718_c1_g1_i1.p1 TRINITY_DN2718_c1_g1~~TRINITY_DN2718_c1_g1_i1.p1  ORF type:complete len:1526 (+),score=574.62 TRINITY_DN2718_c1_g1_i1:565-4578(+)